MIRVGKGVVSIVRLEKDSSGNVNPIVLHEKKTKKRKKSRGPLGIAEEVMRRVVGANQACAASYLARHQKSSRKRRDGWVRDMPINVVRSYQRGAKKLRIWRLIPLR